MNLLALLVLLIAADSLVEGSNEHGDVKHGGEIIWPYGSVEKGVDVVVIQLNDTLPMQEHDEMALLQSMVQRASINYKLGARKNGDRLVARKAENLKWPQSANVKFVLTYPPSGQGAQVTHVTIQVQQNSNRGQSYVVSGGLNQRRIAVAVAAYGVTYLNYVAQIYGKS